MTRKCEVQSSVPCIQKEGAMVAWTIDGVGYCNCCYLDWLDQDNWGRQKVERLYDDEEMYVDMRVQKRHRKSRVPNPCGPPIALRA